MNKDKTYLKIKAVETGIVIGVFVGGACVYHIGIRKFTEALCNINPVLAVLSIFVTIPLGAEAVCKLTAVTQKLVNEKGKKIYISKKQKEDLLKKAEANGWTVVECEYKVEDWS